MEGWEGVRVGGRVGGRESGREVGRERMRKGVRVQEWYGRWEGGKWKDGRVLEEWEAERRATTPREGGRVSRR